ncbi:MAG: DUF6310 domain-containing protein, partial [Cystobacter sp.]
LQRAATLPWADGGRCAVHEASEPWPVLAERCFHALDHDRISFHDPTGRCAVASAGAAAMGLGVCVLAAPEIVVGAVFVAGVVAVGFALKEALDVYELRWEHPEDEKPASESRPTPEVKPVPVTKPAPLDPLPEQKPEQAPKGPDLPPVGPTDTSERDRRPECRPIPVKHRGGNHEHNKCADGIPHNSVSGWDVLVNGKQFDALQLVTRTLWEVKTDDFERQPPRSQQFFVRSKLPELRREKKLAEACGYNFSVGVRSKAHLAALRAADPSLTVVLMDWC